MKNKDESYLDDLLEEFGKEPPFENDRRESATDDVGNEKMKKTNPDNKLSSVENFDIDEIEESFLEDVDLDELDALIHSDKEKIQKRKEGEKKAFLENREESPSPIEEALQEEALQKETLDEIGVQEVAPSDYSNMEFTEEKQKVKDELESTEIEEEVPILEESNSFVVGELEESDIGIEELVSDLGEEMGGEQDLESDIEEKEVPKHPESKGVFSKLFQKLFSNVPLTKEELESIPTPEQELATKQEKAEAAKKKKEEKKQNAEAKKKQKAEEAKKKAAEAKAKKKAKEEAKKEAKKKAELNRLRAEAALPPEGKINKAGAIIVIFFFLLLGSAVIFGSGLVAYDLKISSARYKFEKKEYNDAYNRIRGIEVKEKDMDIHNKVYTVMFVNKQLNSYNNYYAMGDYANALDSLVKGLYRYDKYITYATQIGIKSDLNYVRKQIISEFSEIYGMSERDALVLMGITDQQEYSERVYQIVSGIDRKKVEPKEEIKEYVP